MLGEHDVEQGDVVGVGEERDVDKEEGEDVQDGEDDWLSLICSDEQ